MATVLAIIVEILLIEVHLVKLIKHTTEQTEGLPELGAIQQVKGQRCMPTIVCQYSQVLFDFPLTFSGYYYPKVIWLLNIRR